MDERLKGSIYANGQVVVGVRIVACASGSCSPRFAGGVWVLKNGI